jgi:ATP-dependent protease ClpP protease subunit
MEIAPIEVHEEFSEEIWPWSREALLAKMTEHAYHGAEHVVLDVCSPGGEVASAMSVYQALRSSPFELVTRNMGEVASMGVVLFLAGDKRLASPEATFLLHPIASTDTIVPMDVESWRRARTRFERQGDQSRVGEISERITYLDEKESEIRLILEARTKLTTAEVETLVRQGNPISAIDALNRGIVHEILPAGGSYSIHLSRPR